MRRELLKFADRIPREDPGGNGTAGAGFISLRGIFVLMVCQRCWETEREGGLGGEYNVLLNCNQLPSNEPGVYWYYKSAA